jgi:hypothetical protein
MGLGVRAPSPPHPFPLTPLTPRTRKTEGRNVERKTKIVRERTGGFALLGVGGFFILIFVVAAGVQLWKRFRKPEADAP